MNIRRQIEKIIAYEYCSGCITGGRTVKECWECRADKIIKLVKSEIFSKLEERANTPLPERSRGKMYSNDYLNTPVITMADIYDIQSKWGIE